MLYGHFLVFELMVVRISSAMFTVRIFLVFELMLVRISIVMLNIVRTCFGVRTDAGSSFKYNALYCTHLFWCWNWCLYEY